MLAARHQTKQQQFKTLCYTLTHTHTYTDINKERANKKQQAQYYPNLFNSFESI